MDFFKMIKSLLNSMLNIVYNHTNKKYMHKIWKVLDRQKNKHNNIYEKLKYFCNKYSNNDDDGDDDDNIHSRQTRTRNE